MHLISLIFSLLTPAFAQTAPLQVSAVDCSYNYMGVPFTELQLGLNADGSPQSSVTTITQGQRRQETITPDTIANGEIVHAWISKESADNSIEMIVYTAPQSQGQSKIVNHHVPVGQEVWGTCTFK